MIALMSILSIELNMLPLLAPAKTMAKLPRVQAAADILATFKDGVPVSQQS